MKLKKKGAPEVYREPSDQWAKRKIQMMREFLDKSAKAEILVGEQLKK